MMMMTPQGHFVTAAARSNRRNKQVALGEREENGQNENHFHFNFGENVFRFIKGKQHSFAR